MTSDAAPMPYPQFDGRRPPWPHECAMCGWTPATVFRTMRVTGIIVWLRWSTTTAALCHGCATAEYRDAQAHNMAAGWWGFLAPVLNLWALAANTWRLRRHRDLTHGLRGRDPSVVTPLPSPIMSRPAWQRPVPALLTLAVVGLVVGSLALADWSEPSLTDVGVGSCASEFGRIVFCDDSDATLVVTATTTNPDECPTDDYLEHEEGRFLCLAPRTSS